MLRKILYFSNSVIHAAKVKYLFQFSKLLGRKTYFFFQTTKFTTCNFSLPLVQNFHKNHKREEFPTVQSRNFSCALKKVFLCTVVNNPYLSRNNQGLFQYKAPPLFYKAMWYGALFEAAAQKSYRWKNVIFYFWGDFSDS